MRDKKDEIYQVLLRENGISLSAIRYGMIRTTAREVAKHLLTLLADGRVYCEEHNGGEVWYAIPKKATPMGKQWSRYGRTECEPSHLYVGAM